MVSMKMKVSCFLTAVMLNCFSFSFAQIIPPDRQITWQGNVGVAGGIPNRTTIFTTISAATYGNGTTDATAAVQNAITACPANQVVYLPAGTYLIASGLTVSHPIVIRGAGADKTTLITSNRIMFSPYSGGTPGTGSFINWTGGFTKGSTVLTLASVSGLSAGLTIVLDQHNDTTLVHVEGNEGIQSSYSRTDDGQLGGGKTRAQGQMVKIVSINASANQITIDVPLSYTFQSTLAPQVFYWTGGNMEYAGLENLKIDAHNNS